MTVTFYFYQNSTQALLIKMWFFHKV